MIAALPSGVPPEATEAAKATLGGALEVAKQLPGQLGPALVDAAREAFMQGLRITAAISVVGSLGLAAFAGVMLRRVRPSGEHDSAGSPQPNTAVAS